MGTIAIKKKVMGFKSLGKKNQQCSSCKHMVLLPDGQGKRCMSGGFYVSDANGCWHWITKVTA
jgi:hypothetical protein